MNDKAQKPAWYALQVRSNHENTVAAHLRRIGVEEFLPLYQTSSKRRDRKIVLQRPLFSGYLFVLVDLQSHDCLVIIKTPGVVRLVGFGKNIVPIEDSIIESLKILVNDGGKSARPHPLLQVGQTVKVIAGPFCGAAGILDLSDERKPRLVVCLQLLGRAVSVPVEPENLLPYHD